MTRSRSERCPCPRPPVSRGALAVFALLCGCGQFGADSLVYFNALGILGVGGTVSGLAGTGLVLQNNGGDSLTISANGSFIFPTRISVGGAYNVTVQTSPTTPNQTCAVELGNGLALVPVTNVQVTCRTPTSFSDGAVVTNPFGDSAVSGMIFQYNGKLYVGPNVAETAVFEMSADMSTFATVTIDGDGTIGAPFASFIGLPNVSGNNLAGIDAFYSGCAGASSTTLTGSDCTGAGGTEYNVIGGYNTGGSYQSMWTTTDTSSPWTYTQRSSFEFNVNTLRAMSMRIFKDQLYVASQHQGTQAPKFSRMCVRAGGCANGNALWQITALSGWSLTYMGKQGAVANGQYLTNKMVSIDTMYEYDNDGTGANASQLYIANGGSVDGAALPSTSGTYRDGGILRTVLGSSTTASTPADSSATHWQNVTPTNAKWTGYMSIALPQDASAGDWDVLVPANRITPAIKAVPAMRTAPNGDLYVIRNACSSVTVHSVASGNFVSNGRQTCPLGSEVPQLWVLPQGTTATPKGAADWLLVAETGATGRTDLSGNSSCTVSGVNQCDTENTHVTLLEINGNFLYVGFDNATYGLNVWRTDLSSVASGSTPAASAFTLVGSFGLGSASTYTRAFSSLSYNLSGTDFVVLVAGNGAGTTGVFRTNNQ